MNDREHWEAVKTGKALVTRTCGIAVAAFAAIAAFTAATVFTVPAANTVGVRLDTTKGAILIAVHPDWAPLGAGRFLELVNARYFDDSRFFRVVKGQWAQFGIAADPKVATAWRTRTIPDDPRGQSVTRGKVAFAFAVANGRTTQIYISLRDNSYQDEQGFVPFGEVVEGMDVADALNSEYGESSGGGIRGGKQQPLFDGGNGYLDREYPRLDRIVRAAVVPQRQQADRGVFVGGGPLFERRALDATINTGAHKQ